MISKHALNCCKGSANERNIKTNTKFCFVFPSTAYLIKRLCFTTKTHDKMPQKLQMKHLKNYKWITTKT